MAAQLHFPENPLALHLLLERLERLVDVVVTDENLHLVAFSYPAGHTGHPARVNKQPAFRAAEAGLYHRCAADPKRVLTAPVPCLPRVRVMMIVAEVPCRC